MNLIKSISSIASSSVLSQLIGAFSVWLISHRYGMAEVGHYAMIYSNVLIGAQVCTCLQLLIPRQEDHELEQNVVFCLLQSLLMAIPWAVITGLILTSISPFSICSPLAMRWFWWRKTFPCAAATILSSPSSALRCRWWWPSRCW
jgi:O-antigen/teichoic acid export membrane protein